MEAIWPNLTNIPPTSSSVSRSRWPNSGVVTPDAVRNCGTGQSVAPRHPQHLQGTGDRCQAPSHRSQGVQPPPAAATARWTGPSAEQGLGDDQQDHGGEDPEQGREGVDHVALVASVHHRLGPDHADQGTHQGGEDRPPTTHPDADQPAADQAEHDHEDHGQREGEEALEVDPDGDRADHRGGRGPVECLGQDHLRTQRPRHGPHDCPTARWRPFCPGSDRDPGRTAPVRPGRSPRPSRPRSPSSPRDNGPRAAPWPRGPPPGVG